MIQKIKSAIRIFLPERKDTKNYFFKRLKSHNLIENYHTKKDTITIETKNKIILKIRDYNHSDFDVFVQIFEKEEYRILLDLIRINYKLKGLKIVDAGANLGFTSIFFNLNLPDCEIVSIEPDINNFNLLIENITENTLINTIPYNRALSEDESKKYIVTNNFRDKKDWSLITQESESGDVDSITVNQIIQERNWDKIDILKIDIEGAERFIFKLDNDLTFLTKTVCLAIEIHDEFDTRFLIYDILKSHNFILIEHGELTIALNKGLI